MMIGIGIGLNRENRCLSIDNNGIYLYVVGSINWILFVNVNYLLIYCW